MFDYGVLSVGLPDDYISSIDIAKHKNPDEPTVVVVNWLIRENRTMDKFNGMSMDIEQTEREKLQFLFPQCFIEGKLDILR